MGRSKKKRAKREKERKIDKSLGGRRWDGVGTPTKGGRRDTTKGGGWGWGGVVIILTAYLGL